jgi:hypothetical protein
MSTLEEPNKRLTPVKLRIAELNLAIARELVENGERRQGCRDDSQAQRQKDSHHEGSMLRYFSNAEQKN